MTDGLSKNICKAIVYRRRNREDFSQKLKANRFFCILVAYLKLLDVYIS